MEIKNIKALLRAENIAYIEDDVRLLIDLENLDKVEEIINKHNIDVLDEVTNHKEYGGDDKHYYMIAKPNIAIIEYQNIKTGHCIDIFNNRCIINCKFPVSVSYYGDTDNFDHHKHIRQCLPPNTQYRCEILIESDEIIIKFVNAILI